MSSKKDAAPVGPTLVSPAGPTPLESAPTLPGGDAEGGGSDPEPALRGSMPPQGRSVPPPDGRAAERYAIRSLIGQGGMGEVHLCHDAFIGRDVALKTMLPSTTASPNLKARFLREARVQGRLEHPSIVPVYDVATTALGAPYFIMKRIQGLTFEQILAERRLANASSYSSYSPRRLLTAFGNVCLAVHYAHTKGVVHRDLKPANVMVGSYGEVYVLDWGVAKVADEAASEEAPYEALEVTTHAGSFVGTLGYVAPEQLEGVVGPRSDVYSLGAILFELLTLEPLHRGSAEELTASTLGGVDARASVRVPTLEVPPELEAVCVRATALSPDDRFASARELFEALESYLDGDRDLERRRELAVAHAEAAATAMAVALTPDDSSNLERGRAMREVGHALALDPHNPSALATMARLLVNPPRAVPPDAREAMDRTGLDLMALNARSAVWVFAMWFLWLPMFAMIGILSWAWTGVATVAVACSLLLCIEQARRPSVRKNLVILASTVVALIAVTRIFGPLVYVPTAAVAMCLAYINIRGTSHAFAAAFVVIALPMALEWLGVLPPSYAVRAGELVVLPNMIAYSSKLVVPCLFLVNAMTMAFVLRLAKRTRSSIEDAHTRLNIQTWHLRLMVPAEARHAVHVANVKDGRVSLESLM